MRGAYALGRLLHEEDAPLAALVVWEPVIESDRGPPSPEVRAPLADPRVTEFWDPERRLSRALIAAAREEPRRFGLDEPPAPDAIAWDVIGVYRPGAKWMDRPSFWGSPVEEVAGKARAALRRATSGSR